MSARSASPDGTSRSATARADGHDELADDAPRRLAPRPPSGPSTRIARLWTAIDRTRRELERRTLRAGEIGERFVSLIRPREEELTRAVCRVTERLVDHHERTPLAGDERTLLGLWINENLQSLVAHPFAPRERADALALRWRRHLGAAEHPLDVPLATLYARQAGSAPDGERAARGGASAGPARSGGDDADGSRRGDRAHAARDGTGPAADGRGRKRARDGAAREGFARPSPPDIEHDLRRLLERLFRRLARALHPDREPDETLKRAKDALMSECLRARDERDVGTLLRLYATHVGEPPEALSEAGGGTLERLLREQLDALRRRLRELRHGDALRTLIVERYGAADPAESERRFSAHARALDAETERFDGLGRLVTSVAGLREALGERRELELDRLSIDELTGCAGD